MLLKVGVPAVATLMIGFATVHMRSAQRTPPKPSPVMAAPRAPFFHSVGGAGFVEAQTENIAVGAPGDGLVARLWVNVDQRVKAGEPLFRIDDRHLQAEWKSRLATVEVARARLAQLEAGPRSEALPIKEAKLRESEAVFAKQEDMLERAQLLHRRDANSAQDVAHRRLEYRAAKEQVAQARADLELFKAGAWEPDRALARAQLAEAEALAAQAEAELERLTVRAPIDGQILRVNVRVGERVGGRDMAPPIVMGDLEQLNVRVDIAEADITRLDIHALVRAYVKGMPNEKYTLMFIRLEPEVVVKKSLTGNPDERIDTRVMQVLYRVEGRGRRLYVGQQMDVFIEAAPHS